MTSVGISGMAAYLPPYRTNLKEWCEWTDGNWNKIKDVVGESFRMRGHHQNVYTMAANAVIRLIQQYDIDPRSIGFFGFGTESSTDNSAGAIIIKGMVDKGLQKLGLPSIARSCEVPEFKHACLAGMYALKGAARYLAYDGQNTQAIVVTADIAEYERGSTGEPTQGAGAVAMLLENNPKMLEIDLKKSGSSAAYRGLDFRKPYIRFAKQKATSNNQLRDFPVFNGYFSTNCYIDAMLSALNNMYEKHEGQQADVLGQFTSIFMHRPYTRMPETGLALGFLSSLASGDEANQAELAEYCRTARVDIDDIKAELNCSACLYSFVEQGDLSTALFPKSLRVSRFLPRYPRFQAMQEKMALGWKTMKHVGNLYSASLPAWIAAALEDAAGQNKSLAGESILTIGYGSGDAAEAIPMKVMPQWQAQAEKICFQQAFDGAVDINQQQYVSLHSGHQPVDLPMNTENEFFISRIGQSNAHDFIEAGIEYYSYGEHYVEQQVEKPDSTLAREHDNESAVN